MVKKNSEGRDISLPVTKLKLKGFKIFRRNYSNLKKFHIILRHAVFKTLDEFFIRSDLIMDYSVSCPVTSIKSKLQLFSNVSY